MKKSSLFLIGLMASLAIGVSTSRGQVMYTLEDLGTVKGMEYSQPAALNNLGHVAGIAYKGQDTCAFHYDYSKKFMEDAGGTNSRAFGINSVGTMVGDAFFTPAMEPRSHAALFKGGGFVVDLGALKGHVYSRANGINSIGQVVGFSGLTRDGTDSRAFVWSGQTGMSDLGTLGGVYAQANAINDAGFITGTAQLPAPVGPGATEVTHAFITCQACLGIGRQMRDLGVLGGSSSYGMAINKLNHVAGYSTINATDNRVHAFLYNGKMLDLGSLGAKRWGSDFSAALGINNLDQVVGYTYLPALTGMPIQQVAFLWRPSVNGGGQMINLNSLLYGEGKNYLVFSATAINDNGQIVGSAYNLRDGSLRAVLLTPEGPAPAAGR